MAVSTGISFAFTLPIVFVLVRKLKDAADFCLQWQTTKDGDFTLNVSIWLQFCFLFFCLTVSTSSTFGTNDNGFGTGSEAD